MVGGYYYVGDSCFPPNGEEEDLRGFCWSDTALLNVDKNVSKTRAAIFLSSVQG